MESDNGQRMLISQINPRYLIFFLIFGFLFITAHPVLGATEEAKADQLIAQAREDLKAGRYKDAVKNFEEVLLYDRWRWEPYFGLGEAYYKLGKRDKARWNFAQALAIKDGIADAHFFLGVIAFEEDEFDTAKRHLEEAKDLETSYSKEADFYLGKIENIEQIEKGFRQKLDSSSIVKVKYEGQENLETGRLVVKYILKAYTDNSAIFNIHSLKTIEAIIYTDKQFQQITHSPDWTGALYDGKVRIRMGGFAGQEKELERLVRHEVTHAFVHHIAGSNCPVWLNEGLAQVREGPLDLARKKILSQIANSKVTIPLQTLEAPFFRFPPKQITVAYMVSLGATLYLVDRAGYAGVVRILGLLGQGQTMENALTKELAMGYQDLNYNYKASLREKFRASE